MSTCKYANKQTFLHADSAAQGRAESAVSEVDELLDERKRVGEWASELGGADRAPAW